MFSGAETQPHGVGRGEGREGRLSEKTGRARQMHSTAPKDTSRSRALRQAPRQQKPSQVDLGPWHGRVVVGTRGRLDKRVATDDIWYERRQARAKPRTKRPQKQTSARAITRKRQSRPRGNGVPTMPKTQPTRGSREPVSKDRNSKTTEQQQGASREKNQLRHKDAVLDAKERNEKLKGPGVASPQGKKG